MVASEAAESFTELSAVEEEAGVGSWGSTLTRFTQRAHTAAVQRIVNLKTDFGWEYVCVFRYLAARPTHLNGDVFNR